MRIIARIFGLTMVVACLIGGAGVVALAVYYSNLPPSLRPAAAGGFAALASVLILLGARRGQRRWWAVFLLLAGLVAVAWWWLIPPSNQRDWQPDVAVLPWAEIEGERVMVHNIRNVDYRSETDYTVHHYDRSFDLATLQSVDLFLVYWGAPAIAHTMVSFGFVDGSYLGFSIETRKEVGEEYSAIKGFFKQFELTYVVADERDIVRLRSNFRKNEDVYLYRLDLSMTFARKVLLDYLAKTNSLRESAEWYRAILTNCTTSILRHTNPYNPEPIRDWRLIVNGYLDELLYERGLIDQGLPFAELKARSRINDRARSIENLEHFSREIRAGLPAMKP